MLLLVLFIPELMGSCILVMEVVDHPMAHIPLITNISEMTPQQLDLEEKEEF
jgi:hypothetical protein